MSLSPELKHRLLTARALLAKRENWIQGAAKQGNCYCLWGALFYDPDKPSDWPINDHGVLVAHIRAAIARVTGDEKCCTIPMFNDMPGRTYEDVIKVLDLAIKTA